MAVRLLSVTSAADDHVRLARFWADLLGRRSIEEASGVLVPGDGTQVGLRFVPSRAPRTGPDRTHLHLTSASLDSQRETVATALRLGARHLDVGQRPEEGHVVLADPEGDPFCVIEPGNAFLAGCGRLGEVACEGTRSVGVFWSAALAWPLVWDQDEETAVQSPLGGTKLAWGGPPVTPPAAPDRQHFDLVVANGELAAEVDRLVGLGAVRRDAGTSGAVVLADPDGTEFCVLTG